MLRSTAISSPGRMGWQVAAHAGLVGDDEGVLRVGLALAPVGAGGPVDGPAGDVEQLLAVVDQQRDQQGGPAVGRGPPPRSPLALGQGQDVADQLQQLRLVVGHPPRQQRACRPRRSPRSDAGPCPRPSRPIVRPSCPSEVVPRSRPSRRPRRHVLTQRSSPHIPIERPSRRGVPGGQVSEPPHGRPHESHTRHPWVPRSYEWLEQTDQQRKDH